MDIKNSVPRETLHQRRTDPAERKEMTLKYFKTLAHENMVVRIIGLNPAAKHFHVCKVEEIPRHLLEYKVVLIGDIQDKALNIYIR